MERLVVSPMIVRSRPQHAAPLAVRGVWLAGFTLLVDLAKSNLAGGDGLWHWQPGSQLQICIQGRRVSTDQMGALWDGQLTDMDSLVGSPGPLQTTGNNNASPALVTLHVNVLIPLLIPMTLGVAMLRYRLWDIDIIIRRTLVYGLVTTILTLIYFGSVILMQSALMVIIGQRSAVVIVASTLAIVLLFQPLRRRIQGFIDRRFYRRKVDSAKMLASFATTTRVQVDLEELSLALLRVATERLQPTQCLLWLKQEMPLPLLLDEPPEAATGRTRLLFRQISFTS